MFKREEGFTLVELMVVVTIVGILLTIGLASYSAMTRIADDTGIQLDLVAATKVQALHYLEEGAFTDDDTVMLALEPTLHYTVDGNPSGTVVVSIAAGRAALDVCVFAQSKQGDWFSMRHSATDGDRYGTSSPVECVPATTDAWSARSWGE